MRAIRDRLREMYGRPVERAARPPDRRAGQDGPLAGTPTTATATAPSPRLRERYPTWEEVRDAPVDELEETIRAGRAREAEGAADPGDPRAARRAPRPRLDRDRAARGVARLPALAAGSRAQNGGLRSDLHLGHPRDPGRRPHPPGRRTARPLPAEGLLRARPRRDAGDRRPRGRLRAAHEPDPPRPRGCAGRNRAAASASCAGCAPGTVPGAK